MKALKKLLTWLFAKKKHVLPDRQKARWVPAGDIYRPTEKQVFVRNQLIRLKGSETNWYFKGHVDGDNTRIKLSSTKNTSGGSIIIVFINEVE